MSKAFAEEQKREVVDEYFCVYMCVNSNVRNYICMWSVIMCVAEFM